MHIVEKMMMETKMHTAKIVTLPVLLALSACGGGGGTTNSTPDTLSLSVPQASGEQTQYETLAAALEALPSANEGDVALIPVALIEEGAPEGVNLKVTLGETFNGGTLLAFDNAAFDGNAGFSEIVAVSNLQDFVDLVGTEVTNQTFTSLASETVNGTTVFISTSSADGDYSSLSTSASLDNFEAEAEFETQTLDGSTYNSITAARNSASFTKPSGSFGYSGKAALSISDEVALGDVTMNADFDAGTASITAPILSVADSETTAGFNGSVAIDNASGHYASSSATITVNEKNYDAGIIGTFSSDAATSSGAVFGADQNTAAGVFSVVQDVE